MTPDDREDKEREQRNRIHQVKSEEGLLQKSKELSKKTHRRSDAELDDDIERQFDDLANVESLDDLIGPPTAAERAGGQASGRARIRNVVRRSVLLQLTLHAEGAEEGVSEASEQLFSSLTRAMVRLFPTAPESRRVASLYIAYGLAIRRALVPDVLRRDVRDEILEDLGTIKSSRTRFRSE